MSRYIDADALKIAIDKEIFRHDTIDHVFQIIDDAPTIDVPTWIPCEERLPEEKEWIGTKQFGTTISDLVHVTFEAQGKRFVKPMHFQNGELGGMDKHTMDAFYGEWKVVAWMPLPEPWKGADDGEDNI